MNRPSPDAAVLSERVTRPAIHETTWSDDQQMVLWHMLKYIDQGNRELADRVRVLESSICRCGDCVMHRDKARHGAKARAQECGSYWYQNEPISSASTVPPEPAAPAQDVPNSLDALKAEAIHAVGPVWEAIADWFADGDDGTEAAIDAAISDLCDRAYALGRDEEAAIVEARKAAG